MGNLMVPVNCEWLGIEDRDSTLYSVGIQSESPVINRPSRRASSCTGRK
jgi:hypothetical protein